MERVPITKNGYDKLKKELEHLQKVERPQNIKAIEEARAHGDLSENAEFEVSSPLGRAIVGKKPGDEIQLQAPGGKRFYELVEIL